MKLSIFFGLFSNIFFISIFLIPNPTDAQTLIPGSAFEKNQDADIDVYSEDEFDSKGTNQQRFPLSKEADLNADAYVTLYDDVDAEPIRTGWFLEMSSDGKQVLVFLEPLQEKVWFKYRVKGSIEELRKKYGDSLTSRAIDYIFYWTKHLDEVTGCQEGIDGDGPMITVVESEKGYSTKFYGKADVDAFKECVCKGKMEPTLSPGSGPIPPPVNPNQEEKSSEDKNLIDEVAPKK